MPTPSEFHHRIVCVNLDTTMITLVESALNVPTHVNHVTPHQLV
jgi:hypothetical protein